MPSRVPANTVKYGSGNMRRGSSNPTRARGLSQPSMILGRPQLDKNPVANLRALELVDSIDTSSSTSSDSEDGDGSREGLVIPKQQTNRQAYGTWNRDFDFTLTCIGYVIGLPNFFRFPYLCYKYGTIPFLIPYIIIMILIGIPLVFMEITIGQFFGVGSISAFRQMAPVATGVSYLLAWNSFTNCWTTGAMLSWIRVYSGSSLSCLKGWQGCAEEHYYNTPQCWTGPLEDCCGYNHNEQCPNETREYVSAFKKRNAGPMPESIYFNYHCITTAEFCELFGWNHTGRKQCTDPKGKNHSVYERRQHAAVEYLHGYVMGLRMEMTYNLKNATITECHARFKDNPSKCNRRLLFESSDPELKAIRDNVSTDPVVLKKLWGKSGKILHEDPESSSNLNLPILAFTTVLFITLFLFDNLLRVSAVQYIFNGIPFLLLFYMLALAFQLDYSDAGVYRIFDMDLKLLKSLVTDPEIWVEAVIQVLTTTGVGNGALISLASFNKYQHHYMFDVILILVLNLVISMSATLLCFCTLGHYMKAHNVVSVAFENFIPLNSGLSPVEFGFIVYSMFVSLLEGKDIQVLLFFFMFSSFPSDTSIRLAQSILDAAVHILPRMRHHSTMALLAVVSFYYLTLLPVTENGGVYIYTHFEYYSLRFAFPTIILVEVASVSYLYKARRLVDNAEQLGALSSTSLANYLLVGLKYITPVILGMTLVASIFVEIVYQLNPLYELGIWMKIFAGVFSLLPSIIIMFNVAKQLVAFPRSKWRELFKAATPHDVQKKIQRKTKPVTLSQSKLATATKDEAEEDQIKPETHRGSKNKKKVTLSRVAPVPGSSRDSLLDTSGPGSTNSMSESTHKKDKNVSFGANSNLPVRSRSDIQDEDREEESINSDEVATWQKYIFWAEIVSHFEDWPDRLDETEFESEGSSDDSDYGPKRARVFHVHYPVRRAARTEGQTKVKK